MPGPSRTVSQCRSLPEGRNTVHDLTPGRVVVALNRPC